MKTMVNQMMGVAFLALMLISGNVNATEKKAIVVSGLENMEEVKLEIETWMVNGTFWESEGTHATHDATLEIESWMLDTANWNVQGGISSEEVENQLVVEPWMILNRCWNQKI